MICWKIALSVLVWAAILDGVTAVESKDPVDRGIGETVGKLGSSLMNNYGGKLADTGNELLNGTAVESKDPVDRGIGEAVGKLGSSLMNKYGDKMAGLGKDLLGKVLPKEGKAILNTVTSIGKSLAPVLSMAGPVGGAINSIIGIFSPEPEPTPDPRIDKLLEDTAEIKNMVKETQQSINEVKTQLADLKDQMREDLANLGEEMKETMQAMQNEFMAGFGNLTQLITEQFEKLGQQIKDQFEGQKAYEAFLQFAVMVDAKLEQYDTLVKPAMNQSFADKEQNEKLKLRCITPGYDPLSIISDMYTMAIKNCREDINLPQACLLKEVMVAEKYKTETAALLSNFIEAKIYQLWTYQMVCAGLIHSEPNSLINDNIIFSRKVDQTFDAMSKVLTPLMEEYWTQTIVEEFVKKQVPNPDDSDSSEFKSCGTALDNQYPLDEHLCIRIHNENLQVNNNASSREFETIPKDRSLAISFMHGERYEFVVVRSRVMDVSEAAARLQKYTDWLREDVPPEYKEVDKGVRINNELIGWGVMNATRMGNTTQMNGVKTSLKNTDDDRNRVYAHYYLQAFGKVSFSDPNENSTCTRARNNQIDECNGRKKDSCEMCEQCHYHRCATLCKRCCPESYMGKGDERMLYEKSTDDIPNYIVGCFFVWYDHNFPLTHPDDHFILVFVVHGL